MARYRYFLVALSLLSLRLPIYADETAVALHHGRPALLINGAPVAPFAYMSYLGAERYYREAAEAGIHLYCFPAYLGDRGINPRSGIGPFRPSIWKGEGEYDFSSLTRDFKIIREADPRGRAVIRLHLDPPLWWEEAHPEACCQLPDGTTFRQCFASTAWREATAEVLRTLLTWLETSPFRDQLVGIHVAAGGTEEWFYHFNEGFHDLNPARTEAFRAWLQSAYKNDAEQLRDAWRDPAASFEGAMPADISGEQRAQKWRGPDTAQPVIDTFRFHTQTMADNIAYFCGVVKEQSQRRLLTGAFYGYHYFVNDPRRGHGALGKLLDCPDLDYLSSPNTYHRVMGEDWPPMAAIASVQLHGKLWLAENDTRTFKTTLLKDQAPDICPPGYYDSGVWVGPASVEESVALLRKNTARMLAGGYGGWWFDMWGGWFSDPALMAVLERTQELGTLDLAMSVKGMEAEVCVVADEELQYWDASYGTLTEEIMGNRYALGRMGTPYDLFLLNDLGRIPHDRYRLVCILGAPSLDLTNLNPFRKEGATILWIRPGGSVVHDANGATTVHDDKLRWTSKELRSLANRAGAHIYSDQDDVLYAGHGWLSIHSVKGGARTIQLPFSARVEDAFAKTVLSDATKRIDLQVPETSTTLLRILPE